MVLRLSSVPAVIAGSDRLSEVDVLLNESVKLACVADGLPRPRLTWYLDDDTPLTAADSGTDGVHVGDGGRTLYVDGAHLSHAGRYTCRAVNVAGHDEKRFNLTVLGQSSITAAAAVAAADL